MLPEASVTLQVNGSVPSEKVVPEGGEQTGEPTPGQLSETLGFNVPIAPAGLVHSTTGEGHEMLGACWSTTVTFDEHESERFSVSVTVRVTGVVPSAYGPAGAGVKVRASPSVSNEPLSMEAVAAVQTFKSVGAAVFLQIAMGAPVQGLVILVPYCAALLKSLVVVPGMSLPKLKTHEWPVPAWLKNG